MCDYMHYEQKTRAKVKNPLPEPELEKTEEQPMTVKA